MCLGLSAVEVTKFFLRTIHNFSINSLTECVNDYYKDGILLHVRCPTLLKFILTLLNIHEYTHCGIDRVVDRPGNQGWHF